jgi:hypothetical protein
MNAINSPTTNKMSFLMGASFATSSEFDVVWHNGRVAPPPLFVAFHRPPRKTIERMSSAFQSSPAKTGSASEPLRLGASG